MKKELNIIRIMIITILGALLKIVKALLKILYLIDKAKNDLVAKLFMKLPRLAKVILVYTMLVSVVFTILVLTNTIHF